MNHHPTLSPSSFPALEKCPQYESSNRKTTDSDIGNQSHYLFENIIRGIEVDSSGLSDYDLNAVVWAVETVQKSICRIMGVDEVYLEKLVEDGVLEPEKKCTLFDFQFKQITWGTADIVFYWAGVVYIFDLKMGRQRDYSAQMSFYALTQMNRQAVENAVVVELYARDRFCHRYDTTKAECEAKVFRIINKAGKGDCVACEYCHWCKKESSCKEYLNSQKQLVERYQGINLHSSESLKETRELLQVYQDLLNDPEPDEESQKVFKNLEIQLLSKAEEFKQLWQMAQIAEKFSKSVKNSISQAVKSGLNIPGIQAKEKRGAFEFNDEDVMKVFQVSGLSSEQFLSACKPKLSSLLKQYTPESLKETYEKNEVFLPESFLKKDGQIKKDQMGNALEYLMDNFGSWKTSSVQLGFKKS